MLLKEGDEGMLLGRRITRTRRGFSTSGDERLVQKLCKEHGMQDAKGVDTAAVAYGADDADGQEELLHEEAARYRRGAGQVIYLGRGRMDLQSTAKLLAPEMGKPTALGRKRLRRVIRYLKRFLNLVMKFGLEHIAQSDC